MKNMFKTVSIIMIIMFLGKFLGLLRASLNSAAFGINSTHGNSFYYASLIPRQFLDIIFASTISSSFIPIFNGVLQTKGKSAAYKFASNFLNIVIILTVLITALLIIFSRQLTGTFLSGVNRDVLDLTAYLLRFMLLTIVISGIAFTLTGILQSVGEFNVPAAMSIVQNMVIIIYYLFFMDRFGVVGLCFAFLLGWTSQVIIQLPSLKRIRFEYRFYINIREPLIKQICVLMLPAMFSNWIQPLNFIINQRVASGLFAGLGAGIALGNANEIYSVIVGVFVLSMTNVLLPELSKMFIQGDNDLFIKTLQNSLKSLFFLLCPINIVLLVFAHPIIRLFYQFGNFDEIATDETGAALFYFSIGLMGFAIQNVLLRAFYARKDIMTTMFVGVIAIGVNTALSIVLIRFGLAGVALANSISSLVSTIYLFYMLYKNKLNLFNIDFIRYLMKILISSLCMTVCMIISKMLAPELVDSFINRVLAIAIPFLISFLAYFCMALYLKLNEAVYFLNLLRGFVKWR